MIDVERLKSTPFKIVGTGSVGSFTCLSLCKMGAQLIEVWDDDSVSEVNLPNQFYRVKDIGEYKTDALQSLVKDFEGVSITTHIAKCQGYDSMNGIVIVALDSMLPRKRVWDSIKGKDDKII